MADAVEQVVARVIATSARYRNLHPDLVRRMAADELPRSRNPADAEKRVKRRMHQAFGAYVGHRIPFRRLLDELTRARDNSSDAFAESTRRAMSTHASTRERLSILDGFYREIFTITGAPASLLDVACGLNPLAIPWMQLAPDVRYHALDIDREMVDFLAAFLALLKQPGEATWADAVSHPPTGAVDVALVLKTVPCLERQEEGAGYRLLESIRSRWLVVSFPTRSLGGVSKGMAGSYRASFAAATGHWPCPVRELEFPGELVFVVDRRGYTDGV